MATYTVTGHIVGRPLPAGMSEALKAALDDYGVGKTFSIVLSGAEESLAKGHGALK